MKNRLPTIHGIMLISIFSSHDMALMAQNVPSLKLQLAVEIPANTSATVYLPAPDVVSVQESGRALSSANDLEAKGKESDYVVVEVGSGSCHFTWEKP